MNLEALKARNKGPGPKMEVMRFANVISRFQR
jgi:hypothetical protein